MTSLSSRARALIEAHRKATPAPWYTCGLPWFQTGSGVLAGSPDPHAGALIVDCESWDGEREEMIADHPHLKIADPDDDATFIAAARNDSPAIAEGYLSAVEMMQEFISWVDEHDYSYFRELAEKMRDWLAKHEREG